MKFNLALGLIMVLSSVLPIIVEGCKIRTNYSDKPEERPLEDNILIFDYEHKAGTRNKDYITFEDCHGNLHLYSQFYDGFEFIKEEKIIAPVILSSAEKSVNDPLLISPSFTKRNGNITYELYNFNNNGANYIIKGKRRGNDKKVITLFWCDEYVSFA
ncbi:unnamed protein product [Gordionus sp. m RMFG-2023]|uniref:uncharacterized protein LOC135929904 n=1 Tax=Gordionus sp. m RMFG-2023 TaxID=3053472 RepID=UPI0030E540CF